MSFSTFLMISLGLILSENVVFSHVLGLRSILDEDNSPRAVLELCIRVAAGIVIVSLITWPIYNFLLAPNGLEAARAPIFVLIAGIIEIVPDFILKKAAPGPEESASSDRPFAILSVAVLGCALTLSGFSESFPELVVGSVSAAVGFTVAALILTSVKRQVRFAEPPASFEGVPIALVSAALTALAFAGFAGLHF